MIYDVTSRLFRQFLRIDAPRPLTQQHFPWHRWWSRLAIRILPSAGAARLGFIHAMRLKVWLGLLDILFHRRIVQYKLGLRKGPLSRSDAHIVFRGIVHATSDVYKRTSQMQQRFFRYLLGIFSMACISMNQTMTLKVPRESFSTVHAPATFHIMTNISFIWMLHDVLRQLPDTLLDRPMNGAICWCCGVHATQSRFQKCDRCRVARYCSRPCQINDWATHEAECEGIANAWNRDVLTRAQDQCRTTDSVSLRAVLLDLAKRKYLSPKRCAERARMAIDVHGEEAMNRELQQYFAGLES